MSLPVTLEDVRAARERIAGRVARTPLLPADALGASLKCEHLQRTGSFKPRGIVNAVASLGDDERARGVITMSAGNTAIALAYAGQALGARATVVMPEAAPASKIEASRAYGADIVLHADRVTLGDRLRTEREARGAVLVHPYDDARVIAGQGTIGLEILDDIPDVDLVVVPVGGGGLIAGIAVALAALRSRVRVIGVETRGAPTMRVALDAGEPRRLERIDTIADGLTAPIAGTLPFEIVRRRVADVVLIDDQAVLEGLRFLATRAKQVVEPAGAAAVGALLCGAVPRRAGERVVAILSGGNVDPDRYADFLRGQPH